MNSTNSPIRRRNCVRLVLIALGMWVALSIQGCGTREPAVYPLFTGEIEPADGAVIHGSEVWIRWRSPVPAKGRVFWRKAGDKEFRSTQAIEPDLLLVRIASLKSGEKYEYIVENVADGIVERSGQRAFTVQGGVAFEPSTVDQTIKRDYDQSVIFTLHNASKDKIMVAAKALAQFEDLPADVVGPGSVDEPAEIAPGDKLQLRLAVAAADASRETYEIPIEAGGVFAAARLRVVRPELKLSFRVVEEDPMTLAKTIEIRNEGDVVTDLAVQISSPNDLEVRLQPDAKHAYLPTHASLHFVTTPILYLEFQSLSVELKALAAGQSQSFPLVFTAPAGRQLMGARNESTERTEARNSYCTNNPDTCSEISGTEGNGPTYAPSQDKSKERPRWSPVSPSEGRKINQRAAQNDAQGESNYQLGAKGEGGKFDCSGLIRRSIPEDKCPDPADLSAKGSVGACDNMRRNPKLPWIPESDAREGDIVFFDYEGYKQNEDGSWTETKKDGSPEHCGLVSQVDIKGHKVNRIRHATKKKGVHEGDPNDASGYERAPQAGPDHSWKDFVIGYKRYSCVPAPGPCTKEATCKGGG